MNEEKSQQNQSIAVKNKKFSFVRVIILFIVVFSGYLGLRYFEIKQLAKLKAKTELGKIDDSQSDIFDLAEEYKNGLANSDQHLLSDLGLNEMQEKGAEFFYKMLLKNQEQINILKSENQSLQEEFRKYKSQEKLGKIILAYVDFRQKIFSCAPYEDELKNFEILSVFDKKLQEKITKLRSSLSGFSDAKKLNQDFSDLIPEIIATKNSGSEKTLISKIRHNLSKLVVIRRIDGKNPNDVDGIVARTEKLLAEEKYQEALTCLLALDQSYHEILVNFLSQLSATAEVKKTDLEILSYLKNLS
ncbi:MAG: hypothetical protein EBS06_06350 [Proteobacteria bacterium]|nr:hypothetical protein [Pseudomonadota bacterium]